MSSSSTSAWSAPATNSLSLAKKKSIIGIKTAGGNKLAEKIDEKKESIPLAVSGSLSLLGNYSDSDSEDQ